MIDSAALAWGYDEPLRGLDFDQLVERLKSEDGQVRTLRFGDRVKEYGAWKIGDVIVMPGRQSGKVELRASLPKLLTGRNDEVLDAAGTYDAFRDLAARGSDILGIDLALEEARPYRIDYVFHWEVASVAALLNELRTVLAPARKDMTYWENSSGALGRSLYYGLGTKHVLRFYDKGAEQAAHDLVAVEHGLTAEELDAMNPLERDLKIKAARREVREEVLRTADIDRILRFEVQDRRPNVIRRLHAEGYPPSDIAAELAKPLRKLQMEPLHAFEDVLAREPEWRHRFAYGFLHWALPQHPEVLPVARRELHRNTYGRMRRMAPKTGPRTWAPDIPAAAFGPPSNLWGLRPDDELAA
jgi:hypothetical protein